MSAERIDWLASVRERWPVTKLDRRYSVELGKMLDSGKQTGEHATPYLRNRDVQWTGINKADLPEMDIVPAERHRYTVRDKDLLVCEGGDVGRAAIWSGSNDRIAYQKALHRLRPRSSHRDFTPFMLYHFAASKNAGVFDGDDSKATIAHLPAEDLRETHFIFPPFEKQRAIAGFLDTETARIDTLIGKQRTLIELLKEKRQAVISQAVTKGLDPDVPMKDSGVGWLGEVPAHWNVARLRFSLSSLEQGWSPDCEARRPEPDEYGVLKVGAVNGHQFDPRESKALPAELAPRTRYSLRRGDVLVSRANTRDLVGSAAVVDRDYPRLLLCDKLYRLGLDASIDPDYLVHYLGTPRVRGRIELEAGGASSSMLNIGQGVLKELSVPLPAPDEQVAVARSLSSRLDKIKEAVAKANESLALLRERRIALITAAVTGQIDISDRPSAVEPATA